MNKVQKIEFVSREEMNEYFEDRDVKILSQRNTCHGILIEYEEYLSTTNLKQNETELVRLYTYFNNSKMYYGQKGTTFIQSEAETFPKSIAESKIKFMKGHYDWKIEEA